MRKLFTVAALAVYAFAIPGESKSTMLASWYGPYFHGRTTANGETYNMYGHTAASKTIPFGTKLLVCYQGCTTVRINDRGPYIGGRELDLSYGAAQAIGFTDVGVDYIEVEYL